jgi:serine/threonine-protein kinase
VAILQKIVSGSVPSPRTLKADIPDALEAVCMKALAHARDDRYATAADMAADLEKAIDDLGEKGTVRDAGRLIEKIFASDREAIKKLVEAQAARVRTEDTFDPRTTGSGPRASLPIIDQPTIEGSGSGSHSGVSAVHGNERPSKPEPSHPSSLTAATAMAPLVAPPRRESRARLFVAAGAVAIGAIGAFAYFATRGGAPAATQPTASPTAEAAPKPRQILVDSTPQGASVKEGDNELGKTPFMLSIDPSAPQRRLVMSLDGYVPHTFLPTADDPRILVPLAPAPQAAPTAAPEKADKDKDKGPVRVVRTPTPPPAAPTAPKPPTPSLDINTAR